MSFIIIIFLSRAVGTHFSRLCIYPLPEPVMYGINIPYSLYFQTLERLCGSVISLDFYLAIHRRRLE